MFKSFFGAVFAVFLTGSMASAATMQIDIDFDSGTLDPVAKTYTEDGFTFSSDNKGGAGLANNCPTGSPNSNCLQFNNNEIITVTYSGGDFDVLGFLFNAPGKGGKIKVSDGTTTTTLTESFNGNRMSPATFTTQYDGITTFTFQNVGQGTGRVDNLSFIVAAVPVPAGGVLLLTGLGATAAMRRRKQAA